MRSIRNKIISVMVIFTMLIGMVGIINVDSAYAASKKKIHLKKTTVTMYAGKKYQQKLIDKKGKTIKASKVKWKSLKKSVAKISKTGKITAVKKGTAKMTAKYKGKTYKFTVKVKAPVQNYKISVNKRKVTVMVGETKTLIVKTDNGMDIEFDAEYEYGIECEWGDWLKNGKDSYFYVTGTEPGEFEINVFDSKDYDVETKITVNVISGQKALQQRIKESDDSFIDEDGYRTVAYSITDNVTVGFRDLGDSIEFVEYADYPSADAMGKASMTMAIEDATDWGDVVVTEVLGESNFIEMKSYVIPSKYMKDDNLSFYKSDGNMNSSDSLRKIANSEFKQSLSAWNLALNDLFGLSLRNMGFFNLD